MPDECQSSRPGDIPADGGEPPAPDDRRAALLSCTCAQSLRDSAVGTSRIAQRPGLRQTVACLPLGISLDVGFRDLVLVWIARKSHRDGLRPGQGATANLGVRVALGLALRRGVCLGNLTLFPPRHRLGDGRRLRTPRGLDPLGSRSARCFLGIANGALLDRRCCRAHRHVAPHARLPVQSVPRQPRHAPHPPSRPAPPDAYLPPHDALPALYTPGVKPKNLCTSRRGDSPRNTKSRHLQASLPKALRNGPSTAFP